MSRRPVSKARLLLKRRKVLKDPVFGSEEVAAFQNALMRDGKKSIACKIVYQALDIVKKRFLSENRIADEVFQKTVDEKRQLLGLSEGVSLPEEKIGLVVLYRCFDNTRPYGEVKSTRVGGDTRQMPRVLPSERSQWLGRDFIKKAALMRRKSTNFKPGDKGMAKLLALEIMDAYDGKGAAVKKRTDVHRMVKANQAYVYTRASQDTPPIE